MAKPTQCYRHSRRSWIANCPDCTAWHLASARADRDRTTAETLPLRLPLPRGAVGRHFPVRAAA